MDQVYQNTQSTNNYKPPAFPILGKDYDSGPIIKEELTEEKQKGIKQDTMLDKKSTTVHDKTIEIMAGIIELKGKCIHT